VAQILADSTYPTQIVEAEPLDAESFQPQRSRPGKRSRQTGLGSERERPWRNSHRFLKTWTRTSPGLHRLGDAYVSQPQDVTDAVQTMRQEARKAGHLDSNEQGEGKDARQTRSSIETGQPGGGVYVPAYDPWLGLRGAYRCLSGLVSGARNFLGRHRPFLWYRIWYRLLGRIWVGLGPLGGTTGTTVDRTSTITPSSRTAMDFGHEGFPSR